MSLGTGKTEALHLWTLLKLTDFSPIPATFPMHACRTARILTEITSSCQLGKRFPLC